MVDSSVVTILAYLHVVSGVAWLGGAALFVSVVAPGLRSLSPSARLEFLSKVGPKSTRFFLGAATATIIFGLALLYASGVNNTAIYAGAGLGLVAYLVALLIAVPAFSKAFGLAAQMLANPTQGPPPPDFTAALKRGGIGATVVVAILAVAVVFMVVSGFYY